MAADPNWFYSTIAQSSAAIVGLTGGFFVQRLLVQRTEVLGQRGSMHEALEDTYAEVSQFRTDLERVIEAAPRVAELLRDAEGQGQADAALDVRVPLVLLTDGSVMETRGTEYKISSSKAGEFDAIADLLREVASVLPESFESFVRGLSANQGLQSGPVWLEKSARTRLPARPPALISWLPHQSDLARNRWGALRDKSRLLADQYAKFRAQVIPRSFFALVAILCLFLVVGVIAPLFFLSPSGETARTVMLTAFIPLCFAFIAYLAFELKQLRGIGDLAAPEEE